MATSNPWQNRLKNVRMGTLIGLLNSRHNSNDTPFVCHAETADYPTRCIKIVQLTKLNTSWREKIILQFD
jgi:hypothetical protein